MIESVLFLLPESPYPLHGGGQYRTASLIHYFARFAAVDLVLISEAGKPALLPPGLVRSQKVICLPVHSKGVMERYLRNARRAVAGVPPLIDRMGGLGRGIHQAVGDRRYDLGIAEHFWLAPYIHELSAVCRDTVLDMHNVESMLHRTCAVAGTGLAALGHRRFAAVAQRLESRLLPQFSLVLAASESDRAAALGLAPAARIAVYPNALPGVEKPQRVHASEHPPVIVFSGNFEYHPNIDAVRCLVSEIWPLVRKVRPELRLRLVGRGDKYIRHLLPPEWKIEVSGVVPDAFQEIAAARLVIAPLRMGSGTRIKILEAWAAARPVIATPLAAEGLSVVDGENIALAATPYSFAETILRLLSDAPASERLAANGRRTFELEYTWEAVWKTLDSNPQLTHAAELSRYTG